MIRRVITGALIAGFLAWVVVVILAWAANSDPGLRRAPVQLLIAKRGAPIDPMAQAMEFLDRGVAVIVAPPDPHVIAERLKQARVIRSPLFFVAASRIFALNERMGTGWVRLEDGLSTWRILERLASGRRARAVWVNPGESFAQVSGRFARVGLSGDLGGALRKASAQRGVADLPASRHFPPGLYLVESGRTRAYQIAREALDRFDLGLGDFIQRQELAGKAWRQIMDQASAREGSAAVADPVAPSIRAILSSKH
jgi:cell division protein YceG involved in septum cleavage